MFKNKDCLKKKAGTQTFLKFEYIAHLNVRQYLLATKLKKAFRALICLTFYSTGKVVRPPHFLSSESCSFVKQFVIISLICKLQ